MKAYIFESDAYKIDIPKGNILIKNIWSNFSNSYSFEKQITTIFLNSVLLGVLEIIFILLKKHFLDFMRSLNSLDIFIVLSGWLLLRWINCSIPPTFYML